MTCTYFSIRFLVTICLTCAISDDRLWLYQACTDLGDFVTSEQKSKMFGDNIKVDYH